MISRAKIKFIRSLGQKKERLAERLFVAEGPKVVGDLLETRSPRMVVATAQWLRAHDGLFPPTVCEVFTVDEGELGRCSFLQHPQSVLAVFPIDDEEPRQAAHVISRQLCLALDGVQDPGNLGTILRVADWFGVRHLFCSSDTVDLYNPKVVQATMGSLARVQAHYVDLLALLRSLPSETPVYGLLLDGKNIYTEPLADTGLVVMGNEGKGLSPAVRRLVNHRLLIPSYPCGGVTAESLNVAVATAITCAEFRRRLM